MGARNRHVQHRHAVDGDAQFAQVVGHQPRTQTHQFARRHRVVDGLQVGRARRILGPVRRAEALHPAAFLIDQDRGVGAAHAVAQVVNQRLNLIRTVHVAAEQDEAPGFGLGVEGALLRGQLVAGTAVDGGGGHIFLPLIPAEAGTQV
ncbi:hypothetical protein D3C72_1806780 [compost metagenome]